MNILTRTCSKRSITNAYSKSLSRYRILFQSQVVRHCSTKSTESEKQNQLNRQQPMTNVSSSWYAIYHLPSIKLMASLKRLKLYPVAITAISVPACLGLAYTGMCSVSTAQVVGSIGFSTTLTLLAFSYITNNLVGYIYTDDDQRKVKISFLDFRGKRQDQIYSVDDIIPRSELKRSWLGFYFPLKSYKSDEGYKVVHRYGQIYDEEVFRKVFGDD